MIDAFRWIGGGALTLASAAMAQVPAPTPAATPAAVISVPAPLPTIAVPDMTPTPTPTPTSTATPTPRAGARQRSRPSATQTPGPTPTPSASPLAAPTPAPVAIASPAPSPVAVPPRATPLPPAAPFDWLPWALGAAGLVLLGLVWARFRRDTPTASLGEASASVAETPEAGVAPVYRTSGPWLTVALRPVRAGLNMVTAVADCEITITNEGAAPAEAVRSSLTLLAAHAGQQAEIAAANAEPITRSATPAFTLAPGEAKTFRAIASANLDGLKPMQAGGREMLVPLVQINIQHRDPEGIEHRTSQGFVVGIERVDSPKLAPFWLDSIRMVDQVAARPNGAPERRRLA